MDEYSLGITLAQRNRAFFFCASFDSRRTPPQPQLLPSHHEEMNLRKNTAVRIPFSEHERTEDLLDSCHAKHGRGQRAVELNTYPMLNDIALECTYARLQAVLVPSLITCHARSRETDRGQCKPHAFPFTVTTRLADHERRTA